MSEENLEQVPAGEPETPAPYINPRKTIMDEIAKVAFERHAAEAAEGASVSTVNDEHEVTEPPAQEPAPADAEAAPQEPATPSAAPQETPPLAEAPAGAPEKYDPDGDYKVIVEGQEMLVKGKTIIDAGMRTLQKEAAADHRLRLASQLLEEAERRVAATPAGAASTQPEAPRGMTEEQLAHALQFGTPEESANAVRTLKAGGATEERILQLVEDRSRLVAADEFEFRRGQALLHREFNDLMEKPAIRRLFESEDARSLQAGDKRPYVERYRAIGEQLRKDFGIAKPAAPAPAGGPASGSAAARQVAKAKAPSVPRTAAARMGEGSSDAAKPVLASDVIAGMAAARGKDRLTAPPKR